MPKVSICIEMIFGEADFYDRPAQVAKAGFGAIEFWGYGNKDIPRLKAACEKAGVAIAGFCGPAGVAFVQEQKEKDVAAAMKQAASVAGQLGVKSLILTVGNTVAGVPKDKHMDNIVRNLTHCAPVAQDAGIKLAVEPLNTLVDHKGYFLDRTADGMAIVQRVGSPAVGLLYDIYHMQIMEGNLIPTIRAIAPSLYHVHVADVPGRMEPGTGEIAYANVLKAVDATGYAGYCGFEFRPSDNSTAALQRARKACGLK